jgi:hypothetical protein
MLSGGHSIQAPVAAESLRSEPIAMVYRAIGTSACGGLDRAQDPTGLPR